MQTGNGWWLNRDYSIVKKFLRTYKSFKDLINEFERKVMFKIIIWVGTFFFKLLKNDNQKYNKFYKDNQEGFDLEIKI